MSPSYKEKKVSNKQRRCIAIIRKEQHLDASERPTCYLGVLNAGLTTGLTAEDLLQNALEYGKVSDLVMLPNKSYCFLKCPNETDAENIYNSMNGKARLGQSEAVIYLSYFNEIPDYPIDGWDKPVPPGLVILPDFINEEEEIEILKAIAINNESEVEEKSVLKHRRVKHFGYEFLYGVNNVDPEKPLDQKIPKVCDKLWIRLKERIKEFEINLEWDEPDQLTVNEYEPGQGIPPHVDTHSAFLDPIVSLSLLADVVMDFKKLEDKKPLILMRHSLLVMSGESRYDWTHGISPRFLDVVMPRYGNLTVEKRSKRISLTFRKLRKGPCNCSFPRLCDTRLKTKNKNTIQIDPVTIEEQNVHQVYDAIANHFSETRHTPWPKVASFLQQFPIGSVLLDVGCGNGKYLHCNRNILTIGCDRSQGLLDVCIKNGKNAFRCDCLTIPIRSDSIDGCISIAVIHHLATKERRLDAIREMARILKPGGKALIYVWAKDQKKSQEKSSYLRQNKAVNKNKTTEDEQRFKNEKEIELPLDSKVYLPIHTNRTEFRDQDLLVPWKLKDSTNSNEQPSTFLRYYHVFEENELETMVKEIDSVELVDSYYDQGNHCVIFSKK